MSRARMERRHSATPGDGARVLVINKGIHIILNGFLFLLSPLGMLVDGALMRTKHQTLAPGQLMPQTAQPLGRGM